MCEDGNILDVLSQSEGGSLKKHAQTVYAKDLTKFIYTSNYVRVRYSPFSKKSAAFVKKTSAYPQRLRKFTLSQS